MDIDPGALELARLHCAEASEQLRRHQQRSEALQGMDLLAASIVWQTRAMDVLRAAGMEPFAAALVVIAEIESSSDVTHE